MVRKINGFSKWLFPQIFAFGIFQTCSLSVGSKLAYENVIVWVLLVLVLDILSVDVFRSGRNGDIHDK